MQASMTRTVRQWTRVCASAVVLALTIGASLPAAADAADDGVCEQRDAIAALTRLADTVAAERLGGPLVFQVTATRVAITERATGLAIASVSCDAVRVSAAPTGKGGATERFVSGAGWRLATSARGARTLVLDAGALMRAELHLTVIETPEVESLTVGEGSGRVLFSQRLAADGTLTTRTDARLGCGCERELRPDGRLTTREL
jgi:hypothetical protein